MSDQAPKSLREILLSHQLVFIALILLAVISGIYGIYTWDKASKESERINYLVQEIHQVRGDLYRQMKELFDAFFLKDKDALNEYSAYTQLVLTHFDNLNSIAQGNEEKQAIAEIKAHYNIFVNEAPSLFYRYEAKPDSDNQKSLYQDIETGIFSEYELVSQRAEKLLNIKQLELKKRLNETKITGALILVIPVLLAGILLLLSRAFLNRAIVNPIQAITHATEEISAGNLQYKVPEAGALELASLSKEINKMAEDLANSRDALIKSEKQSALGLLVPMLAHNIRNPLASIRATAQVADDPALDQDTRESLQGIMATVDRLERWTSVLLAYLNPIKPQLNNVPLGNIVEAVTNLLAEKLSEKDIQLNRDIQETSVMTDEHLLEQMLYNLMLNAIEASPKSSVITLSAHQTDAILTIHLSDEGAGMPFTPAPSAVSPGPSTKRFGTGLGIPFAFKVCEVLGGQVTFSPVDPQGTAVKITLPQ